MRILCLVFCVDLDFGMQDSSHHRYIDTYVNHPIQIAWNITASTQLKKY